MIKILGITLTVGGAIALILGILGIFGTDVGLNAWAMSILGIIFFLSGIGLLKRRQDTDKKSFHHEPQ